VHEQPDDANRDARDARPGEGMVFLGVLLVAIVVVVALLYGFLWPMWSGN
jgi:hypothetical protein